MRRTGCRSCHGAVLAESSVTSALFIGLVLCILFVFVESTIGALILNSLNQSANNAAHGLAMLYAKTGGGAPPDTASVQGILKKAMIPGVVNSNSQFNVIWPSSYTKNSHPPQSVTVICSAAPGGSGTVGTSTNMSFPWGALSWFSSTFSLQSISLKSSATISLRP